MSSYTKIQVPIVSKSPTISSQQLHMDEIFITSVSEKKYGMLIFTRVHAMQDW